MNKMLERIRAAQARIKTDSNGGGYDDNENIFFDFTDGTHRLRLVGEWVTVHSHWIGNSKYSTVTLYPDSAFQGENKLRKQVNCPDFDIDTEMPSKEKSCVICHLHDAVNDILYPKSGKSEPMEDELEKYLKDVSFATKPRERTFFLCIDRDSPEIAPGKKGLKIVEFPLKLMQMFYDKTASIPDFSCFDEDKGCDIIITSELQGKNRVYKFDYAMSGLGVATNSLTEEERNYKRHDIKKIMCKMPDQSLLYDKLNRDLREILDDVSSSQSHTPAAGVSENAEENVPF